MRCPNPIPLPDGSYWNDKANRHLTEQEARDYRLWMQIQHALIAREHRQFVRIVVISLVLAACSLAWAYLR